MEGRPPGAGSQAIAGDPWQRLAPGHRWSELVLPESQLELLRTITAELTAAREDAGASRSRASGRTLLFSGPAGTGKTMAARIVGAQLGMPILEVNTTALGARDRAKLDTLLGRVFAKARKENAILYFDRADAVLAERPVRGASHGRPGVLAAPDLFERAERHPTPVIYASALSGKIDAAYRSHFSWVIEFPFPDAEARERIWRQLLSPDTALTVADIEELAGAFQLPGAAIVTCCAAAQEAADRRGDPIGLVDVAAAVEAEYRGRLASDSTLAAVASLLARARAADSTPTRAADSTPTRAADSTPTRAADSTPTRAADSTPTRTADSTPTRTADSTPTRTADSTPTRAPDSTPNRAPDSTPTRAADSRSAPRERGRIREPGRSGPNGPSRTPAPTRRSEARTNGNGGAHAPGLVPERPSRRRLPEMTRLPLPDRRMSTAQRIGYALLAAGAVVAAAGVGFLAAQLTGGAQAARAAQAAAGPIRASVPAGWHASRRGQALGFTHELTLAPGGDRRARLTIGTLAAGDPNLLPAPLRSAVHVVPPAQVMTIGGLSFYGYPNLVTLPSGATESVYATPTTLGTLVGVCTAPASDPQTAGQCERILSSLRIVHGTILGTSSGVTYARSLDGVLGTLDAIRGRSGPQLAAAHTASAQALAAGQLAAADAAAAAAVSKLRAGSAAAVNSQLAAALQTGASAYGALANAAQRHDTSGYTSARALVVNAEAEITAALARLSALGYRIG